MHFWLKAGNELVARPKRVLRHDGESQIEIMGGMGREERFLSAQADRFAGAKREEKASACSVRNDELGLLVCTERQGCAGKEGQV